MEAGLRGQELVHRRLMKGLTMEPSRDWRVAVKDAGQSARQNHAHLGLDRTTTYHNMFMTTTL